MYVAVKGGEAAIKNAHRLLADRRRRGRVTIDLFTHFQCRGSFRHGAFTKPSHRPQHDNVLPG